VSPHNAEVLLNLARVLLVQHYLDDATYLARRSLELQPPDRNAWEQYLTLGQIFKVDDKLVVIWLYIKYTYIY